MSAVKAKESHQIHKAREKIKQNLAAAEKKMNPDALQSMRQIIQQQLARHRSERVTLKKRVKLFDENQHPAETGRFVSRFLKQLQKTKEIDKDLEGRIKPL